MRLLALLFWTTALYVVGCTLYIIGPVSSGLPSGTGLSAIVVTAWVCSLLLVVGGMGVVFRCSFGWKTAVSGAGVLLILGLTLIGGALLRFSEIENLGLLFILLVVPAGLSAASLWVGIYLRRTAA